MLKYLYIKDFVIFDEITVDLSDGFSAFTGETGAGKSIMVDAISLLCAQRSNPNLIAKGKECAIIEGVFDFSNAVEIKNILTEYNIDFNDEIIITRIIKNDGKSSIRLNHRGVNLSLIKEIMDIAVDIHLQHDTHYLLKSSNHIKLLDNFGIDKNLLADVKSAYEKYSLLKTEMDKFINEDFRVEDLELFNYEINEINNANLTLNEDEEILLKEKQFLAISKNLDKINKAVVIFDSGFIEDFFEITKLVSDIDDKNVNSAYETFNNAYYEIDEAMLKIKDFIKNFDISEDEINRLQERSFEINRLKRKYGNSIASIFKYRDNLIGKVNMINNRQEYLATMEKEIAQAKKSFLDAADILSKKRHEKAKELDMEIMKNLSDLMLYNAQFSTKITLANENLLGIDKVEFLISLNLGEDLKPLSKVASGGELSRLMLGLKVIFTKLQGIKTVIFDEIDSGVSGPVATSIGIKMKELAKHCQVLSITHLAQVAACAKNHYHVSKLVKDNKTKTIIKHLNNQERVNELAIIASGEVTKLSLEAAKELYDKNQDLK